MYIAHYPHNPEDTAVGFGATVVEAANALVLAYPPAKGKELTVSRIILRQGAGSLEDLPERQLIIG
jgi:hypothetical protein